MLRQGAQGLMGCFKQKVEQSPYGVMRSFGTWELTIVSGADIGFYQEHDRLNYDTRLDYKTPQDLNGSNTMAARSEYT